MNSTKTGFMWVRFSVTSFGWFGNRKKDVLEMYGGLIMNMFIWVALCISFLSAPEVQCLSTKIYFHILSYSFNLYSPFSVYGRNGFVNLLLITCRLPLENCGQSGWTSSLILDSIGRNLMISLSHPLQGKELEERNFQD